MVDCVSRLILRARCHVPLPCPVVPETPNLPPAEFPKPIPLPPSVRHPKPAPCDELGQPGAVGWKMMKAAKILNDAFMCRVESAATV